MKKIILTHLTILITCYASYGFASSTIDNQEQILFDSHQTVTPNATHSSFTLLPSLTKTEELMEQDKLNKQSLLPTQARMDEIAESQIKDPYNIEVYYISNSNNENASKFMHNNMLSFMGSTWDNGTLISTPTTEFSRFINQKSLNPIQAPLAFANFIVKEPCLKGIPYQVKMHVSDITETNFNIEGSYQNISCRDSMPNYSKKTSNTKNTNLETFVAKSQYDTHSSTSWVKIELNHDDYLVVRVNKNYEKQY